MVNNVPAILKRMISASIRAGRSPNAVKLVAVSKFFPVESINDAIDAGLRDFGESYVQEAVKKAKAVAEYPTASRVSWHFVGHLQKNKARAAVKVFDLIHSLDSVELAFELDKHAGAIGKVQRVLLQVNISGEWTKSGAGISDVPEILSAVRALSWLKLEGFMVIPPYHDDPDRSRPYFRRLRELRDNAIEMGYDTIEALGELSMGMSNDFEVAIEEGATIVRIGSAIFGSRQQNFDTEQPGAGEADVSNEAEIASKAEGV
ncbi:MAG: YggS family pyridoxal phosphate-dependent enzyme [Nitrospirae bacterium]|nr:YggS family pyridoxal phosphate-dependent enzyme [Nitrospirota bacterium]